MTLNNVIVSCCGIGRFWEGWQTRHVPEPSEADVERVAIRLESMRHESAFWSDKDAHDYYRRHGMDRHRGVFEGHDMTDPAPLYWICPRGDITAESLLQDHGGAHVPGPWLRIDGAHAMHATSGEPGAGGRGGGAECAEVGLSR